MQASAPPFAGSSKNSSIGACANATNVARYKCSTSSCVPIEQGMLMLVLRSFRTSCLRAARCLPRPAIAQAAPTGDPAVVPPPPAQPVTAAGKRSTRRPTSRGSRPRPPTTCWSRCRASPSARASTERGLGQASENVLINGERIANKSRRRRVDQLQRVASQQCRADRDRRRREPGHRRACRARSPTSS